MQKSDFNNVFYSIKFITYWKLNDILAANVHISIVKHNSYEQNPLPNVSIYKGIKGVSLVVTKRHSPFVFIIGISLGK